MTHIIKTRESNFELLRIVSMLMVVTLHFMGHGGILNNVRVGSFNFFIANLMESFSIYAVNLYILISAYFMCESKITVTKVLKVWTHVVFYGVSIYFLLTAGGIIKFNIVELIKAFFPIIFNQYSFVTGYIVLMILSPFLNKMINVMSKEESTKLLIVLFIFFSILGVGFPISKMLTNYLTTFIFLYFISAYIKKYTKNKVNNKYNLLLYIMCSMMIFIGRIILYSINKGSYVDSLLGYEFILVILGSVGLFIFVKNIKIQSSIINKISTLTFGVYLIHDNINIRNILYKNILNIDNLYNNKLLILITVI
ncbi:acyltransferase, partial [Clostridium beijerinckii]